jgi:peptidoglycan/xylan/chitin deacetylase (PgdA/CDA1 family)
VIERVPSGAALTFDAGPDPDATPAALDALDAAGLRATFFLLGERLMRHPALAREAAARGHELALNGDEWVEHASLRPQAARDDLARGLGAFEAATGRRPRFYRPPHGRFSEASLDACLHLRMEPVGGSGELAEAAIVLLAESPDEIAATASRARELGVRLAPLGELLPA